jgi:hypothetical protein
MEHQQNLLNPAHFHRVLRLACDTPNILNTTTAESKPRLVYFAQNTSSLKIRFEVVITWISISTSGKAMASGIKATFNG